MLQVEPTHGRDWGRACVGRPATGPPVAACVSACGGDAVRRRPSAAISMLLPVHWQRQWSPQRRRPTCDGDLARQPAARAQPHITRSRACEEAACAVAVVASVAGRRLPLPSSSTWRLTSSKRIKHSVIACRGKSNKSHAAIGHALGTLRSTSCATCTNDPCREANGGRETTAAGGQQEHQRRTRREDARE